MDTNIGEIEVNRDLNEWQKSLSEDEIKLLTRNGHFPLPYWPSYSEIKKISTNAYYGALGYGNGTEHKVLLVIDHKSHGGCIHVGVVERGFYNFNIQQCLAGCLDYGYISDKMRGVLEWEAHLLGLNICKLVKLILTNQPTTWERPSKYCIED